jgi:hypothetical protein
MCSELASIDDPRDRRRFAIGCAAAALRTGPGRGQWLVAIGVGILFAVGTFAASRGSLGGEREGIMGFTLLWPELALLAVAFGSAMVTRSFRAGLVTGALALLAGIVAMLAVSMAEAAHWHDVARVFLMDGDAPSGGRLERIDAVLDPVRPTFVVLHVLIWAPWPVLGAAAGAWSGRVAERRDHGGSRARASWD